MSPFSYDILNIRDHILPRLSVIFRETLSHHPPHNQFKNLLKSFLYSLNYYKISLKDARARYQNSMMRSPSMH